ncbi:hypothetical protein [Corynebacterium sp. ACRPS]|uniref:hypothetical protein n=1 Tax=Corynebacterium sp. ACRPS TaxID=2918194 RepID=UPI001EF72EB3|nr:hypothetical protein [Corynebacterium sp. ACRPS]
MAAKKNAKKNTTNADNWFSYTTNNGDKISLPPIDSIITVGDRRRAKRDGLDDEDFSWMILERAADKSEDGTLDAIDSMRMDEFNTFMQDWSEGGDKS